MNIQVVSYFFLMSSLMSEIINKCDLAYSMIQRYQDNDSALIDEKQNIYKLVDEVSALVEKCELEPQEVDNLTYYFEYDIACTLETQIGEVRYLKPGEKGWFTNSPFLNCLKPLYQSEAWCTTIHMKMSLIYM